MRAPNIFQRVKQYLHLKAKPEIFRSPFVKVKGNGPFLSIQRPSCIVNKICSVNRAIFSRIVRRVEFDRMKIVGGESHSLEKGYFCLEYHLVIEKGEILYCEGSFLPIQYRSQTVVARNFPRRARFLAPWRRFFWMKRCEEYNVKHPDIVTNYKSGQYMPEKEEKLK